METRNLDKTSQPHSLLGQLMLSLAWLWLKRCLSPCTEMEPVQGILGFWA